MLKKHAKKHGLVLHKARVTGLSGLFWLTPYAAQRLIAFARAKQGDYYLAGKNYHRTKEIWRNATRRYLAKRTALNKL